MAHDHPVNLRPLFTPGSTVQKTPGGWKLTIPAGNTGEYRVAQLDDYHGLPRSQFPHRPPLAISLHMRACAAILPGTWGFGLWNDPFSLSLGLGGGLRRFPALPNTAWFFFASPRNYLTLQDDLPGAGNLAATFRARPLPVGLLALISPLAGGLLVPGVRQWLRTLLRRKISQDSLLLHHRVNEWHRYSLHWEDDQASFTVDGETVLETQLAPLGPLGLVIWLDNQFAAFPPHQKLSFGTEANPEPVWIEISDLDVQYF